MAQYKTNSFKLIGLTAIILFLIGVFSISSALLYVTERSLHYITIAMSPPEIQQFKLSIGLLLALTSPVALLLSWAFSGKISVSVKLRIYFLSLCTAVLTSILGLWFRLMEIKSIFYPNLSGAKILLESVDYFKYGLRSMLIICLPLAFILYRRKKKQKEIN